MGTQKALKKILSGFGMVTGFDKKSKDSKQLRPPIIGKAASEAGSDLTLSAIKSTRETERSESGSPLVDNSVGSSKNVNEKDEFLKDTLLYVLYKVKQQFVNEDTGIRSNVSFINYSTTCLKTKESLPFVKEDVARKKSYLSSDEKIDLALLIDLMEQTIVALFNGKDYYQNMVSISQAKIDTLARNIGDKNIYESLGMFNDLEKTIQLEQRAYTAEFLSKTEELAKEINAIYEKIRVAITEGLSRYAATQCASLGKVPRFLAEETLCSRNLELALPHHNTDQETETLFVSENHRSSSPALSDSVPSCQIFNHSNCRNSYNIWKNFLRESFSSETNSFCLRIGKKDMDFIEEQLEGKWGSYNLFEQWLNDSLKWQWLDFQAQLNYRYDEKRLDKLVVQKIEEILLSVRRKLLAMWMGRICDIKYKAVSDISFASIAPGFHEKSEIVFIPKQNSQNKARPRCHKDSLSLIGSKKSNGTNISQTSRGTGLFSLGTRSNTEKIRNQNFVEEFDAFRKSRETESKIHTPISNSETDQIGENYKNKFKNLHQENKILLRKSSSEHKRNFDVQGIQLHIDTFRKENKLLRKQYRKLNKANKEIAAKTEEQTSRVHLVSQPASEAVSKSPSVRVSESYLAAPSETGLEDTSDEELRVASEAGLRLTAENNSFSMSNVAQKIEHDILEDRVTKNDENEGHFSPNAYNTIVCTKETETCAQKIFQNNRSLEGGADAEKSVKKMDGSQEKQHGIKLIKKAIVHNYRKHLKAKKLFRKSNDSPSYSKIKDEKHDEDLIEASSVPHFADFSREKKNESFIKSEDDFIAEYEKSDGKKSEYGSTRDIEKQYSPDNLDCKSLFNSHSSNSGTNNKNFEISRNKSSTESSFDHKSVKPSPSNSYLIGENNLTVNLKCDISSQAEETDNVLLRSTSVNKSEFSKSMASNEFTRQEAGGQCLNESYVDISTLPINYQGQDRSSKRKKKGLKKWLNHKFLGEKSSKKVSKSSNETMNKAEKNSSPQNMPYNLEKSDIHPANDGYNLDNANRFNSAQLLDSPKKNRNGLKIGKHVSKMLYSKHQISHFGNSYTISPNSFQHASFTMFPAENDLV